MFDWYDYLKLAESLLRNSKTSGPEEAALRSAISRAYYAAFHEALDFALNNGEYRHLPNGNDHTDLAQHFMRAPDRPRRKIGVTLNALRQTRNMADYRRTLRGKPVIMAQVALADAQAVITLVQGLR